MAQEGKAMATGARRKTNPDHKASFSYGVTARCSCGWSGATWFGEGAKSNAAGEWHWHREKCEEVEKEAAA
jgi:hypothetical protein